MKPSSAAQSGRPLSARGVIALALASAARGALVLLACAPPLWLAIDLGLSYPATKLAAVLAYGAAGLAALGIMGRGLVASRGPVVSLDTHGRGDSPRLALVAMAVTFLLAGGQTAWVLRPFLGDPRDREVPLFVQQTRKEGGLVGALSQALGALWRRP